MADEHETKKEALIDLQSYLQDIAEKKFNETLQASIRAKIAVCYLENPDIQTDRLGKVIFDVARIMEGQYGARKVNDFAKTENNARNSNQR